MVLYEKLWSFEHKMIKAVSIRIHKFRNLSEALPKKDNQKEGGMRVMACLRMKDKNRIFFGSEKRNVIN